jgi:hypothetical protein
MRSKFADFAPKSTLPHQGATARDPTHDFGLSIPKRKNRPSSEAALRQFPVRSKFADFAPKSTLPHQGATARDPTHDFGLSIPKA